MDDDRKGKRGVSKEDRFADEEEKESVDQSRKTRCREVLKASIRIRMNIFSNLKRTSSPSFSLSVVSVLKS